VKEKTKVDTGGMERVIGITKYLELISLCV